MLNEMYTHNSRSLGICNYLRSLFDWTQLSTHFHIDLEMAEIVMNFHWIIIGIATEFKEKEMSSRPEPSSKYMNQFFCFLLLLLHSFFSSLLFIYYIGSGSMHCGTNTISVDDKTRPQLNSIYYI